MGPRPRPEPPTWGYMIWSSAVLLAIAALVAVASAQRVTIQVQPDTVLRLFLTYRSVSDGAVSSRDVTTSVNDPAVCGLVPVPGTTRGRYQYVLGRAEGACWVRGAAIVSGVTYQDSVYVVVAAQLRFVARTAPPLAPPPPVDQPPAAAFVWSCGGRFVCTLDGRGSTDAEGPIARYAWDLGKSPDGAAEGVVVTVTYPHAGPRTVRLVVTDAAGQADSTVQVIEVPDTVAVTPPPPLPPPPVGADTTVARLFFCPPSITLRLGDRVRFCTGVVFGDGVWAAPSWDMVAPECVTWRPAPGISAAQQAVADRVTYGADTIGTMSADGWFTATSGGGGYAWAELAGRRSGLGSCPVG